MSDHVTIRDDRLVIGGTELELTDENGEHIPVDHASPTDGYVAFSDGDSDATVTIRETESDRTAADTIHGRAQADLLLDLLRETAHTATQEDILWAAYDCPHIDTDVVNDARESLPVEYKTSGPSRRYASPFDANEPTFGDAIDLWGADVQVDMASEEAAELVVELADSIGTLAKFIVGTRHFKRDKIDEDALVDELADVWIMREQLARYIGREQVRDRAAEKMDRLRERVADGDGAGEVGDGGD